MKNAPNAPIRTLPQKPAPGEKFRILVVEDDAEVARLILLNLARAGLDCRYVNDGLMGLTAFREADPHLILLDLMLPGCDGRHVCMKVREKSTVPIIILTAMSGEEPQLQCSKLGADDFVTKPCNPKLLIARVLAHLRRTYGYNAETENMDTESQPQEPATPSLLPKTTITIPIGCAHCEACGFTGPQPAFETVDDQGASCPRCNHKENIWVNIADLYRPAEKEVSELRTMARAIVHSANSEFFIIGSSTNKLRKLIQGNSEAQEKCDSIAESVEYTEILCRRLMDYLQIGKPPLVPIDVLEIVRKVERAAQRRLPANIQLNVTADNLGKNKIVLANAEQIIGVLLELIHNARNVLHENGGEISFNVSNCNDQIVFSVTDNGSGVPRELRDELLKQPVLSKSGSGVGLFLSNQVMQALGGQIIFETSDQGTEFSVSLPLAPVEAE